MYYALRKRLSNWVKASLSPVKILDQEVLPAQERALFQEYTRNLSIFGASVVAIVLLIQDILLWPTDYLVYPAGSSSLSAVLKLRLMVAAACTITLVGLKFVDILRRRPVLFTMVMLTISMAYAGWLFGKSVDMKSPLVYQIYSMPMATILIIVPLGLRILTSTLLTSVYLTAFFMVRPKLFTLYDAGGPIIWLLAAVSGAVVVGHVFYVLLWSNFHKHHLLDKAAQERNRILNRQAEDISALVEQLDSIEERERLNFAQEIHDELGQVLAGLRMEVDHLHMLVDRKNMNRVPESFKRLNKLFDSMNNSIHFIIQKLRPGELEKMGLIAMIERGCITFQKRYGLLCNITINIEEESLSQTQVTNLYRIIQESITNVAKHANASMVDVELSNKGDVDILKIRDDGQGFDIQQIKDGTFGLAGIRERTRQINGSMQINTAKGKGTEIIITFPVKEKGVL